MVAKFTAHYFRGKKGLSPVLQAKTPPVTIQDVAAPAICTVSRVLRNVSVKARAKAGDAAAKARMRGLPGSLPSGRREHRFRGHHGPHRHRLVRRAGRGRGGGAVYRQPLGPSA